MARAQSPAESNQEEFLLDRFPELNGNSTATIAERVGLPKELVHKILVRLRKSGRMSYANGWYFNG